jgi:hypothetical protein
LGDEMHARKDSVRHSAEDGGPKAGPIHQGKAGNFRNLALGFARIFEGKSLWDTGMTVEKNVAEFCILLNSTRVWS